MQYPWAGSLLGGSDGKVPAGPKISDMLGLAVQHTSDRSGEIAFEVFYALVAFSLLIGAIKGALWLARKQLLVGAVMRWIKTGSFRRQAERGRAPDQP
jgi:hypothetical protein